MSPASDISSRIKLSRKQVISFQFINCCDAAIGADLIFQISSVADNFLPRSPNIRSYILTDDGRYFFHRAAFAAPSYRAVLTRSMAYDDRPAISLLTFSGSMSRDAI